MTLTEVEVTSAPTEADPDDNSTSPTPVRGVLTGAPSNIAFSGLGDDPTTGADDAARHRNTRGNWTFKVTYTVAAWGPYVVDVDSAGGGGTAAPTVTGLYRSRLTSCIARMFLIF